MQKLNECLSKIRRITNITPKIAVVLGSGMMSVSALIKETCVINFNDIPPFPKATVEGHNGRLIFGTFNNVPIIFVEGRIHYYEGYDMKDVVFPIRILKLLGVQHIILTNAAGGINDAYKRGDFVIIKDHISSFIPSPLRGQNYSYFGVRYPDMRNVYDPKFNVIIKNIFKKCKVRLHEGIYLQIPGPQFETPAEINLYKNLNADLVGMSTVCEAITAKHCGMNISAISLITDITTSSDILTIDEIIKISSLKIPVFKRIIKQVLNEFTTYYKNESLEISEM